MSDSRLDWNASPHPISDLRDWSATGRLVLRPSYQRSFVWPHAARVSLIDTILRNIPMPMLLMSAELNKRGLTVRSVIDGQQRVSTILRYLSDHFPLESPPCEPQFDGLRFSELPQEFQDRILQYKLDFNEVRGATDSQVREIFTRLNKYTIPLNTQEMRRAEYRHSKFLQTAESLVVYYGDTPDEPEDADLTENRGDAPGGKPAESNELFVRKFFASIGAFTLGDRRRMWDVEFVSELLAGFIIGAEDHSPPDPTSSHGPSDSIDSFYARFADWPEEHRQAVIARVVAATRLVADVFSEIDGVPFRHTIFRHRVELHSLILAVDSLLRAGGAVDGKDLKPLKRDFSLLQGLLWPGSPIRLLNEFADRNVAEGGLLTKRAIRVELMARFLKGTLLSVLPTPSEAALFVEILALDVVPRVCVACRTLLADGRTIGISWPGGCREFQLSNAWFLHADCCGVDTPNLVIVTKWGLQGGGER